MQVLALVTLWPGPIAPGEQAEVPDEQAQALIARGLASALPGDAPAFNPPAGKPGRKSKAQQPADAETPAAATPAAATPAAATPAAATPAAAATQEEPPSGSKVV